MARKPARLGQQRGVGVHGANNLQRSFVFKGLPESGGRGIGHDGFLCIRVLIQIKIFARGF